ncbi:MAG: cache domain-containing protein [Pseudomonadota bacterium]
MDAAASDGKSKAGRAGAGRWIAVVAIVLVAGVLSGFYALNEYATGTATVVKGANGNAGRFEAIFRDLMQARFRTMSLAADVMLQSRVTVDAFARDDRAGLVARIEPFFEILQKQHNIEQLNFWQAPAKLYYRAGRPDEFGMDLSAFRRSIVAANERRQRVLAIETGQGGVVALRAIVPVTVDGKFIGVLEFVSGFDIPLERASETAGLAWAVSLNKETAERVERPVDPKVDSWQNNDVYFHYSDPQTAQAVRSISFDPRSKDYSLAVAGGRTIFVKTFPVVNFSGQPTITIATLLDVSAPFADVFQSVAIKSAILFLVLAVGGSVAFVKFGQIRNGLMGAIGRQKKELEERVAFCDAAVAKLKEVDLIKRGFFSNLVTAVNEPLQAVTGQLRALAPAVAAAGAGAEVSDRLEFALAETSRLSRLVDDYQQIELFRQKLVKNEAPPIALAGLVAKSVDEDLAIYRRLPQLTIAMAVPADLAPTRADPDLLRRAIGSLVGYAAQRSGRGKITITGVQDEAKWLVLSITGSAFTGPGAPSEALLDESRQFLSRLASGSGSDADGGPLIGVALARIIVEFYGGGLELADAKSAPGFIIRLPAAA